MGLLENLLTGGASSLIDSGSKLLGGLGIFGGESGEDPYSKSTNALLNSLDSGAIQKIQNAATYNLAGKTGTDAVASDYKAFADQYQGTMSPETKAQIAKMNNAGTMGITNATTMGNQTIQNNDRALGNLTNKMTTAINNSGYGGAALASASDIAQQLVSGNANAMQGASAGVANALQTQGELASKAANLGEQSKMATNEMFVKPHEMKRDYGAIQQMTSGINSAGSMPGTRTDPLRGIVDVLGTEAGFGTAKTLDQQKQGDRPTETRRPK